MIITKDIELTDEKNKEVTLIWRGKPTLAAFWPFYLVGCMAGIMGVLVGFAFSFSLWFAGILVAFVAGMFVLPPVFRRAWTFTVTKDGIRSEFHLIVRRTNSAPLYMVMDVIARQGFIGRLLGFGTIRIDTAGTSFPGVYIWGVKRPFKVERMIGETVKEHGAKKNRGL